MWLTNNETQHSLEQKRLKSFEKSFGETTDIKLVRQFGFILILLLVFLLLPWTQNIKSGGKVTTLRPEQQ